MLSKLVYLSCHEIIKYAIKINNIWFTTKISLFRKPINCRRVSKIFYLLFYFLLEISMYFHEDYVVLYYKCLYCRSMQECVNWSKYYNLYLYFRSIIDNIAVITDKTSRGLKFLPNRYHTFTHRNTTRNS